MSNIRMSKKIPIGVALAVLGGTLAWATPGSLFVTTPLVRSTASVRINVTTHPNELNDVQVQSVVGQPGGYSGWHSHPGYGIVAVTLRHCRDLRRRRPDVRAEVRRRRRGLH